MTSINLLNCPRDIRDSYIENVEILEKVKTLVLLPDGENMTVRQVADYYEIDLEVARKAIQRHREELTSDGMVKLNGRQLEEYKSQLPYSVPELKKVPSTQLLPRRAILRMGMVLKNSKIAEKVRTYLLEAEKLITSEQKQIIFQGSWTEEIDQYIINRVKEDEEQGIRFNDTLQKLSEEIHATAHQIKNYWYVGAQGKGALRHRVSIRSYSSIMSFDVTTNQQEERNGYFDLFDFATTHENEKIIQEQRQFIQRLIVEFHAMKEVQDQILKENNEMKIMLNEIHKAIIKTK